MWRYALLSAVIYLGKSPATAEEVGKCKSPESFKDKVACKMAGCEYNLATKSCQAGFTECNAGVGITGCRRSNAFYSEGGVVYHYKKEDQGDCSIKNLMIAVNLGSWGKFTDTRNMTFEYDSSELWTDPGYSRRAIWEGTQCQYNVTGVDRVDYPIWSTQILAYNTRRKSGNCLTYHLKIVRDGVYELNIRTVESFLSEFDQTRQFNIRVNGIDVIPELNIRTYVNLCEALELVIEFEVKKGKLNIAGLPSQDIFYHGKLDVGFCYGDGKTTAAEKYLPDYLVSAFYVAEMNGAKDTTVSSCSGGDGGGGGGFTDTTADQDVTLTKPSGGGTATCYGLTGCRKYKSRYLEGGVLFTHNEVDQGNCSFKDFRLAINLGNVGAYTESTGISYDFDYPQFFTDKGYSRQSYTYGGPRCEGYFPIVHPEDHNIWRSAIHGNEHYRKKGRCIVYHAKVKEDGLYILNLKTVETFLEDKSITRKFNIKVNDITILPEFNMLDHVYVCEPLEFNVEFEVKRGVLTVAGYPGQDISYTGQFDVAFCYGDEDHSATYTPDYLMSAIYVVQLEEGESSLGGKCSSITNTPPVAATPAMTTTTSTTDGSGGTASPIAPCQNLSTTEGPDGMTTTSEPDTTCIGITGCRRGGSYYNDGGNVLHTTLMNDKGNCNHKRVVLALNLGGAPSVTDHRGIEYKSARAEHYSDKDKVGYTAKGVCQKIRASVDHHSNHFLYGYQVRGDIQNRKPGRCITYHFQIPQDGVYELGIKTVEAAYGADTKTARHMNVRLNGMTILPEFNLRKYAKKCEALDVNVEFEVKTGVLKTTGFAEQPIADGKVDISFCYGDKPGSPTYDPHFAVSALYIAQMEGTENIDGSDLCPHVTETPPVTTSTTQISLTSSTTLGMLTTTTPKSSTDSTIDPDTTDTTGVTTDTIGETTDTTGVTTDTTDTTGVTTDTTGITKNTPSTTPKGMTTLTTQMPPTTTTKPPTIQNETILPEQNCSLPELNEDPAACKDAGCIYNNETCECQPKFMQCEEHLSLTKCRRSNSFYNRAGQICYNEKDSDAGECSIDKLIIAINLACHCDGCDHTDSRGIKYEPDSYRIFTDEHDTRLDITGESNKCQDITTHIPPQDTSLYHSYITGDIKNFGRGRCTNYNIQLEGDGRYEFNFKTLAVKLQNVASKARTFNIRLNGLPILQEFHARSYISDCHGMELITEFEVRNGVLIPAGPMGNSLPANGSATLGFCYGDKEPGPEYNPGYIAAAFYVAKIKEPAMCRTSLEFRQNRFIVPRRYFGGSTNMTKTTTTRTTTTFAPVIDPDLPEQNCRIPTLNKSPDACNKKGCRYDPSLCSCEPIFKKCEDSPPMSGCRRANSFYNRGGQICYNSDDTDEGNCNPEKVITAVNIGCQCDACSHNDSRGIVYEGDSYKLFRDEHATRRRTSFGDEKCSGPVLGIPRQDEILFTSLVKGHMDKAEKGRCMHYPVQIPGDGRYELSIKTLASHPNRHFNIRLSDMVIFQEYNINQFTGKCYGMDVITEFKVQNGVLSPSGMLGHPIPEDGKVKLGFCYGNKKSGKDYDPSYIAAAFYVAKMPGGGGDNGGNGTMCKSGCAAHNGKPMECKMANCEYNMMSGRCQKGSPGPPPVIESGCRRANVIYIEGGVASRSKLAMDKGNCTIKSTILAVNLGGGTITDSRGVGYQDYTKATYSDDAKSALRQIPARSQCRESVTVKPYADRSLYIFQILGDTDKSQPGRCVTFSGKVAEDGRYELNVKMLESKSSPGQSRHFNIRLNGMVVAPEFNILKYAEPCHGIEIMINFEVKNGDLAVAGFPGKMVKANGKVEVGFCYGDGRKTDTYDPAFLVSSFYVVRM